METTSLAQDAGPLAELLRALDETLESAVGLRHDLHAEPELGNEEEGTTQRLQAALHGVARIEPVATTGFVARVGPVGLEAVGLRAELDGLPLVESTGAPFAATNGRMHACGHDVHMAALVAMCQAAAAVGVGVARPLVAVFQPSEERYPSGARAILDDGVLGRHRVGAMVGVHVHPDVPPGAVAAGTGVVNASSDEFDVVITGDGGHGAYPHLTPDPVLALSQVVVALHHVVSRRVDPLHPAVLTVGSVSTNGAANVIPRQARARGTLRCLEVDDRPRLQGVITEVAHHAAAAHGCDAQVRFIEGEPALDNHGPLVGEVVSFLPAAGLPVADPLRSCGADDFGYFTAEMPGAMLFLGVETGHDLHHPAFLPPDRAVRDVARALLAGYVGGSAFVAGRS